MPIRLGEWSQLGSFTLTRTGRVQERASAWRPATGQRSASLASPHTQGCGSVGIGDAREGNTRRLAGSTGNGWRIVGRSVLGLGRIPAPRSPGLAWPVPGAGRTSARKPVYHLDYDRFRAAFAEPG